MRRSSELRAPRVRVAAALLLAACGAAQGVPEGKLAAVGAVAFGPEDLADVQAQLGAYAQLRFGGEGRGALLQALVDAEVLAQEAAAQGLADDPRVAYAWVEELAAVHESAEMERRVPRATIAADRVRLRAWYDAHLDAFVVPERRSAQGVLLRDWAAAEAALATVRAGPVELASLGDVVTTPLQARDDAEFPGFHPVLFDDALAVDDVLPQPVVVGERLLVGRVASIEPSAPAPFDDAAVQERLVEAVRAPLVAAARTAWLAELGAPP